jgi:4-hydroxy-tetrahydrodipicolinate reductase
MAEPRVVLYGVGYQGSLAARMLLERGVDIVGAIAQSDAKEGRDLGDVAGLGRTTGVIVRRDAAAVLSQSKPDIAVVAVTNPLPDHKPHLETCARAGVNAITISVESLYPWPSSPDIAEELDQVAKEHGVTITGTGFQDVFFVQMVADLMGAAHRIDRVVGRSVYDSDDGGPELARRFRIGTPAKLGGPSASTASRASAAPSSLGKTSLYALAAVTGLTVERVRSEHRIEIAAEPMKCKSLDRVVEPGQISGQTSIDRMFTREGVELVLEVTGQLAKPGMTGVTNDWTIHGDPTLKLITPEVPGDVGTCTQMINRIPDVISAEPGFITIDMLPPIRYRHSLHV